MCEKCFVSYTTLYNTYTYIIVCVYVCIITIVIIAYIFLSIKAPKGKLERKKMEEEIYVEKNNTLKESKKLVKVC